jgi:hypothetical protein
MNSTTVWVDTDSGTWGDISTLRIVEVENDRLDWFADISDGDRCRIAQATGSALPGSTRSANQ